MYYSVKFMVMLLSQALIYSSFGEAELPIPIYVFFEKKYKYLIMRQKI
jgi:hypothetical protein